MASAMPKPPPPALIHQIHRIAPLTMAQPPGRTNNGPWHSLMQAHIANITSHKAMLESLAKSMDTDCELDTTLVANMEAMYGRTIEIMDQAQGVKAYFDKLALADPARSATSQIHSKPSIITAKSKSQMRPRAPQANAPPRTAAGRRRRSDQEDPTGEEGSDNKRRRVADTGGSKEAMPQPSVAQESDVEYVDVTKEVIRRMAATRERRMAKKVAAFREEDEAKRKRRSSGEGRTSPQAGLSNSTERPTKRLKDDLSPGPSARSNVQEKVENLSSVEGDRKSDMPGAFDESRLKEKKAIKRTKSIV